MASLHHWKLIKTIDYLALSSLNTPVLAVNCCKLWYLLIPDQTSSLTKIPWADEKALAFFLAMMFVTSFLSPHSRCFLIIFRSPEGHVRTMLFTIHSFFLLSEVTYYFCWCTHQQYFCSYFVGFLLQTLPLLNSCGCKYKLTCCSDTNKSLFYIRTSPFSPLNFSLIAFVSFVDLDSATPMLVLSKDSYHVLDWIFWAS